jgi:thiamine biosynthesis lipoprotein
MPGQATCEPVRRTEIVMGMPVTIDVRDAAPATVGAIDEAFGELRHADELFSPFLPGSAVSRINRGELDPDAAGSTVRQVLELCRLYEAGTGGYFSAHPRGALDPSGLVKGWALDRAAGVLERHGLRSYLVDGAGDVCARGSPADGSRWRVGIRHPYEKDRVVRVLEVSDAAVATSGSYEKGPHIVDPHTGKPELEMLSLTVVGRDILEADVFATAAFAMGLERGLAFISSVQGYEAFAIGRDLRGTWTPGFEAYCA